MTKVRIPPTLRGETGGEREVIGEGETVREVLENIGARYPALQAQLFEDGGLAPFVNVYLGGEDVRTLDGLDTRVDGSSLILLPAMAGGAPTSPIALGSRREGRAQHGPSLLRLPATRREPGRRDAC